jgi:hypothetical protein
VTAPDIVITRRARGVIGGSVRNDSSVWDVRWSSSTGWDCTRSESGSRCAHALAVEQLT